GRGGGTCRRLSATGGPGRGGWRRSGGAAGDGASGRGRGRLPRLVHQEEKRVVDQAFEPRADPLRGDDGEAVRLEERPPRLRGLEGKRRVHSPAVAVPVETGVGEIEPGAFGAAPVDRLHDEGPGPGHTHPLREDGFGRGALARP